MIFYFVSSIIFLFGLAQIYLFLLDFSSASSYQEILSSIFYTIMIPVEAKIQQYMKVVNEWYEYAKATNANGRPVSERVFKQCAFIFAA